MAVYRRRPRVVLVCPSCGSLMHAKRRSLRFFAHDRAQSECDAAGETEEHLKLKALIAHAARVAGLQTTLEFVGRGYRCDVLISNPEGTRRVAFEVQVSGLTVEDGAERTRRMHQNGIDDVAWVATSPHHWQKILASVQVESQDDGNYRVVHGCMRHNGAEWSVAEDLALSEFVVQLFDEQWSWVSTESDRACPIRPHAWVNPLDRSSIRPAIEPRGYPPQVTPVARVGADWPPVVEGVRPDLYLEMTRRANEKRRSKRTSQTSDKE
jgi:competence protein CoiA-like protein